jgi:DnaJ-class molecular chaperone
MTTYETCPKCGGDGHVTCNYPGCNGTGVIHEPPPRLPLQCPQCNGTGLMVCPRCKGAGKIQIDGGPA